MSSGRGREELFFGGVGATHHLGEFFDTFLAFQQKHLSGGAAGFD